MSRDNRSGRLAETLRRHPFSSRPLLGSVFGEGRLDALLKKEMDQLCEIQVAELGPCYAERREPKASLLGLARHHLAREHALGLMGAEAWLRGASPGPGADGEFFWRDRWWRVWVDLGACALEALRFVAEPPRSFRGGVRDIILVTRADRLEQLARLVERSWSAQSRRVNMFCLEGNSAGESGPVVEHRSLRPQRRALARTWKAPTSRGLQRHCRDRQDGSRHWSLLGEIARQLDDETWDLLGRVGSNPLMSARELAATVSPSATRQRKILGKLKRLDELKLVETPLTEPPEVILEERKTLTWRGVELLAHRAGTTVETLRRRQPWPLRRDARKKGKTVYSLRWLRLQSAHQKRTRQFALATLEGARRVSRETGGAEVEIITTIGGRMAYENRELGGTGVEFVAPDAVMTAELWKAPWLEGRLGPRRKIRGSTFLVEIDRSTMSAQRLAERMDRYEQAWRGMEEMNPALVWVINGTPFREAQILSLMRERKLSGWTTTLERLVLPEGDPWWLKNPLAERVGSGPLAGLSPSEFGHLCPWRRIWHEPTRPEYRPLLGCELWKGAAIETGDAAMESAPGSAR